MRYTIHPLPPRKRDSTVHGRRKRYDDDGHIQFKYQELKLSKIKTLKISAQELIY